MVIRYCWGYKNVLDAPHVSTSENRVASARTVNVPVTNVTNQQKKTKWKQKETATKNAAESHATCDNCVNVSESREVKK